MQFSDFGKFFGGPTGIMELMEDMGKALSGTEPMNMLGGGNPARIPAVDALWRDGTQACQLRYSPEKYSFFGDPEIHRWSHSGA